VAELEGPDRVRRRDVQRPVAGDARRPGVAGDARADNSRPALDELGEAALRAEAGKLAAQLVRQPVQGSPPPPAPAPPAARSDASP
jgi:hypothetical protein